MEDIINTLTSIPAEDVNFKGALERATGNQIRIAIGYMEHGSGHDKTRIAACKRELKRRDKNV